MRMCVIKQDKQIMPVTIFDLLCNTILTYRSQERIKEVLCTTPDVHVVG